jgi:hypothetical protein
MTEGFRYPDDSHRITIIGKTGSGKTQGAAWQLSRRSFQHRPWIIFDYKYDSLLNDIRGTHELGVTEKIPKKPGLYIVHPTPGEDEDVEKMLWAIWEREKVGVYLDEGYMLPTRSPAFQAILTQGRSKQIPLIMLTQRPSWITRFALSEADFIQLYQLTDQRDVKTCKSFLPLPIERPIPQYHSWWYDNSQNFRAILTPVPDREKILDAFRKRLTTRKRIA